MKQIYRERTWELIEEGFEQVSIIEEERPKIEGKKERQARLIELL